MRRMKMDKYGTVDDVIEPLDDGMYYMVDDVDALISSLEDTIRASFKQTDELIAMVKEYQA